MMLLRHILWTGLGTTAFGAGLHNTIENGNRDVGAYIGLSLFAVWVFISAVVFANYLLDRSGE